MENIQKSLGFDIETSVQYISKGEFPFIGEIQDITPVKGKYGMDYRLQLKAADGRIRHFDLWGENKTYCVNVFGKRAENYIGKWVQVTRDADLKRKIEVYHV